MGRTEVARKGTKKAKLDKKHSKTKKAEEKKEKLREKKKKDEIEPIDEHDNYVLPSAFEIGQEDLLLFEKLDANRGGQNTLELNVKNYEDDLKKQNPAKDPEISEVYQK